MAISGACAAPAGAQPSSEGEAHVLAASLLAQIPVPPGAVVQPSEPVGDNGLLARSGIGVPATPDLVDLFGWWIAGGTPSEALAYVAAHPPAGYAAPHGGGSLTKAGTVLLEWVSFSGPDGVMLGVSAARLAGGGVGLRADAEVLWRAPASGERGGPRGREADGPDVRLRAREATHPGPHPRDPLATGDRPRRQAPRRAAPSQPGVRSCPSDGGRRVRVALYGARGHDPLAVARVALEGCGSVALALAGVPQTTLESTPPLIAELSRLAPGRRRRRR